MRPNFSRLSVCGPYQNTTSLASSYNALKEPENAIKHAENALSIDPAYAPAMLNKAKALRILGKTEESNLLIEKAIKLHPELKNHIN